MRCIVGSIVLVLVCWLLSGCSPPTPEGVSLSEAIDVVGATLKDDSPPAKDTGGPTIVRPKLTSNSSTSFDVEVTGVTADDALTEVAQLAVSIDGLVGHYLFEVRPEDRTPSGSILLTVVQEQPALPVVDGAFKLRVVAANAAGDVGSTVDVSAAFFAASAGEDSMAGVEEPVPLVATFTGETGTPAVTWSQISGPTVNIVDPFAASTAFVPEAVGTYVMKLEAVDPTGVIDVDLVSILVVDEFTVDAGESLVVSVGERTWLRGLAAGGVGQATFAWSQISGPGVFIEDHTSRVASFVPDETGEHEFELAATDEAAGTVVDRAIFLAVDGLTALAHAPAQADPGATILLQGQAAGGLPPYAFRWSQTSGPAVTIEDATNQTALVTLPSGSGTYRFQLRVADSTLSSAIDTVTTEVDDDCQDDINCDDGDLCTTDTCVGGACLHTPIECDNGFFCDGVETCDPQTGECVDNEDPCDPASESCDEVNDECLPVPVDCTQASDCDDGDLCTTDACEGGSCVFAPFDCDDGFCDPATGDCVQCLTDADCDDADACTTNACDGGSCVITPRDCDDGNACTTGTLDPATCECSHEPVDCGDSSACLGVSCDELLGCVYIDLCPDGEICVEGTCLADEFVFSEDFEGGLADWYADNGIWEVGVPTSGPGEAHSPTQLAATVLAGNYPINDSRLISPPIELPTIASGNRIILRFWHWFELQTGADYGEVQIRVQTASGDWGEWTSLESYTGVSAVYTHALVPLTEYAGTTVQIAYYLNEDGYRAYAGWYIDDVTIDVDVTTPVSALGFFESFDNGQGDWFVDNGIWEVGVPSSGPGQAYSPAQLAATVLAGDYPINDSRLISPPINLPSIALGDQVYLRFWHWFELQTGADYGEVQIREQTAPGEWGDWATLESYTGVSEVYTHALVYLTGYAGTTIQIAYYLHEDGYRAYDGWYIDDITIEGPW